MLTQKADTLDVRTEEAGILRLENDKDIGNPEAVGYAVVGIPPEGRANLVAYNFRASGGADMTLEDQFGTNVLTQGVVPTMADTVSYWDGSYTVYFQKPDGKFYASDDPFGNPVNPILGPGQSFWLQSPVTAGQTNEVYLVGEISDTATHTQALHVGYNLLDAPYPGNRAVSDNDYQAEGGTGAILPTLADMLWIWNGAGYDSFFLTSLGAWGDPLNPWGPNQDPAIPSGVGAWYDAKSAFTTILDRP